jgi:outer membrane protein TolC
MKKIFFIFFPFLAFSAELHQVVQSAYRQAWELENAQYLKQNADADYSTKKYSFLPALSLSTSHGFQGAQPSIGTDKLSDYKIEAKANLLSLTQLDDLSISRAGKVLQEKRFFEQKNQFCFEALKIYLNYLLEKKRSTNLNDIESLLEDQFEVTSSEYKQGIKPRKDYLRLRAELRGVQLDQNQQLISLKNAEDLLRNVIKEDFSRFNYEPSVLTIPELYKNEEDVKLSIKEETLTQELSLLTEQRKKLNNTRWPQLTLGAQYNFSDSSFWAGSSYNPSLNQNWSITLGVSYVLWDWGTERRSRESGFRNNSIRENEVYQEIRTARMNYDLNREKIRVARKVYAQRAQVLSDERESYNIISRDYREGKITFLDYVSSLRSYTSAELGVFQALVELNKVYYESLLQKGQLVSYFQL